MHVDLWPLDRIRPYTNNPRRMSDRAVRKLADLIREFGFRQPIVVDRDGVIVAGHRRLAAAHHLGLDVAPVHVADNLTEAQIRAYRLADNRIAEETDWIEDALKTELGILAEFGFDLGMTGFELPELGRLLHSDEDAERAEETPDVPAEPVSVPGDLWRLGNHRLLCGDATVATDVEKVLGGVKPHLMVTDPPYGVEYDASFRNRILRKDGNKVGARAIGKVENDDRADWREAWALFPGDVAYVWHAGRFASIVQESLAACGFAIRAQIIWAKSNIAIGRGDYHWQHEPAWYAVCGSA
jgi:hypothetical protein